jgi:hypothetical protein
MGFDSMYFVKKTAVFAFLLALICIAQSYTVSAQGQKRVIQLSGVVLGEDSVSGLPGVFIYVPKAGRGTTTNSVGFFSMPVLVGDSIVISCVGYAHQYYIVPNHPSEFLTVVFEMDMDVTYLSTVTVSAFPTEEVFKEAVLALNLPPDKDIDPKNMNQELLALMLRTTPMDGPQNQRYYLNQWANGQGTKYMPVTNPFLNPFNWVKFFNSLKTDKKKKKPQKY